MLEKIKKITCQWLVITMAMSLFMSSAITTHAANSKREAAATAAYRELGSTNGSKYRGTSGTAAWCVDFARWCARQAGLDSSQWPNTSSTNALLCWFQGRGRWHNKTTRSWSYSTMYGTSVSTRTIDSYTPQKGDFVAIDNDSFKSAEPDHTAIVYEVNTFQGYVRTVEGNIGGKVVTCTYSLSTMKITSGPAGSNSTIVGFGEPDYGSDDVNYPKYNIEKCVAVPGGIQIIGWTFDPDAPSKSIQIHAYIGGSAGSGKGEGYAITADLQRDDVNKAYGITGKHGFNATISTSLRGDQTVYLYPINEGPGGNPCVYTKTVNISTPFNISFDPSNVTLSKGESRTVNVKFSGDGIYTLQIAGVGNGVSVKWGSVDYSKGTTSFTVTGDKGGSYTLAFNLMNSSNGVLYSKNIAVKVNESASIKFTNVSYGIKRGEQVTVDFSYTGSDVGYLNYEISNNSVIQFSKWGDVSNYKGKMTLNGIGAGTSRVYLLLLDNNQKEIKREYVTITVSDYQKATIVPSLNEIELLEGESTTVYVNISKGDTDQWHAESSSSTIASVITSGSSIKGSNNDYITIKAGNTPGEATIKIYAKKESINDKLGEITIKVKVKKKEETKKEETKQDEQKDDNKSSEEKDDNNTNDSPGNNDNNVYDNSQQKEDEKGNDSQFYYEQQDDKDLNNQKEEQNQEEPDDVEDEDVIPQNSKIRSLKVKKGKLIIKYDRLADNVTGIQIQISKSKNFKKGTTKSYYVKNSKSKAYQYTIKKRLKSGKWYVRVRTYINDDGDITYSEWSKKKNVKIK